MNKAQAICELYRTKKYSQTQIAEKVGVVQSYVSKVVNKHLTLDELDEIMKVMNKRKGAYHPLRGKRRANNYGRGSLFRLELGRQK